MKRKQRSLVLIMTATLALPMVGEATVKVVTTVQDYAAIARDIGKDRVTVEAIVAGNADAHFIKPKPSYAIMLRDADLFVSTGLDLELWTPVIVNKAGNRKIIDGAEGYVSASHGVELLQKPASMDRSAGDVHIYGNPHITTSPLNITVVARNIATGLCKVDPEGCDAYKLNLDDFNDRIARRLYGDQLLETLGVEALDPLARSGRLVPFLDEHGLLGELGGWLGEAMPFRGQKLSATTGTGSTSRPSSDFLSLTTWSPSRGSHRLPVTWRSWSSGSTTRTSACSSPPTTSSDANRS